MAVGAPAEPSHRDTPAGLDGGVAPLEVVPVLGGHEPVTQDGQTAECYQR